MIKNKVDGQLPRPLICDNCGKGRPELARNRVLYGKDFGKWPLVWWCRSCKAAVSCHPNTDIPMGKMADRYTRKARSDAHAVFDKLWKKGYMERTSAYHWLLVEMGLTRATCHISHFNKEQCEKVIKLSTKKLEIVQNLKQGFTYSGGKRIKLDRKGVYNERNKGKRNTKGNRRRA